jgi:hypothetical protein
MKIINPLFLLVIICSVLVVPGSAEVTTIQLQSLGLTDQDVVVFAANGTDMFHGNTSSTFTFDWNVSPYYTIQFQPSVTNIAPESMVDTLFQTIQTYWLPLLLIIALLLALSKR